MPRAGTLAASAIALLLAACAAEQPTPPVGTDGTALPLKATAENASPPAAITDTELTSDFTVGLETVAEGLENPWGIAFLPDGTALVTEVARGLRVITADGTLLPDVVSGIPVAFAERQGGYLGLAFDPGFESNRTIYLAYSEGSGSANTTAVFKGRLSDDLASVTDGEVIFRATERSTAFHYGARMDFLPDGTMLISLGDGFRYMKEAQNLENYHGKIVRIRTDGSIPEDNPFATGPAPAVWSFGHRNVQGLYVDDQTGTVFAHEHGPRGGDELNRIHPGSNYGWPSITYGINYDGSIITNETEAEGMEQPLVKWVPSIAACGMTMYRGDRYPGWSGDLFIGGMEGPAGLKLVRVDLDDAGNPVGQEALLTEEGRPIRDVALGPDGFLYVVTKELDSGLYRVVIKE